jgi:anti-sigma regulatory factor (Ser/Thr protein kinase)
MIDRQTRGGTITSAESGRLNRSLDRVIASVRSHEAVTAPSEFRKQLTADRSAPGLARAALVVTAAGVRDDIEERAELLTSELVTNSVERTHGGPLWLAITLGPDVLRVEVADEATSETSGPADERARWSFAITAELASRWGAGRDAGLNVAWFEIDLSA